MGVKPSYKLMFFKAFFCYHCFLRVFEPLHHSMIRLQEMIVAMAEPIIPFFGSTEIVRVGRCRKLKTPVVCHICKQTTKQHIIFGEQSVGACCFPKIEQSMLHRMPSFLMWITQIVKSRQQYTNNQTEIINRLIGELGGIGIQFIPRPTSKILDLGSIDYPREHDLFGDSTVVASTLPDILCEWCNNTIPGEEDSVPITHFADMQILSCCCDVIERSAFFFMPQIIPWFISQLQNDADQITSLQNYLSKIREAAN